MERNTIDAFDTIIKTLNVLNISKPIKLTIESNLNIWDIQNIYNKVFINLYFEYCLIKDEDFTRGYL
ncbi:MAG: hypothetical protein ACFFCM_19810 [Promethearchaeota archaeon]